MADIGERGELLLSSWCSEVDLVANRSSRDLTGWDHILEFPMNIDPDSNKVHKAPHQCKIQVKATNGGKKRVSITLSNLQRMATDPLPFFILYIEYDDRIAPQKVYLKYVDASLISKILKKIHIINQSNKENKLNKKTMSITFSKSDEMAEFSGKHLKECINKYIGTSFEECLERKQEILKTAGFEDGSIIGTIKTQGLDNINKMIDMSLGKDESVELLEFTAHEQRFGIKNKNPLFEEKLESAGMLSMPNVQPSKSALVSFKAHPLKQGFEFKAGIYFSPFVKDIQDELFRYRLEFAFGDVMVFHHSGECNFTYSFDDREFDIWECQQALRFVLEMIDGVEFTLSLTIEGETISFGKISTTNTKYKNLDYIKSDLRLVESATSLLVDFGVREPIKFRLPDLIQHEKPIYGFADTIRDRTTLTEINFTTAPGTFIESKEVAFIGVTTIPIGHLLLTYFYSVKGFPIITNDINIHLKSEIVFEDKILCKENDEIDTKDIEELIQQIRRKYEASAKVIHPSIEQLKLKDIS